MIKTLISISLLFYIHSISDVNLFKTSLSSVTGTQIFIIFCLIILGFLATSYRFLIILDNNLEFNFKYIDILKINHLASFLSLLQLNTLLPELSKVLLIKKTYNKLNFKPLSYCVIMDKVYGFFTLIFFVLISMHISLLSLLLLLPILINLYNRLNLNISFLKYPISYKALFFSFLGHITTILIFLILTTGVSLAAITNKVSLGIFSTFIPFTFNGAGVSHITFEKLFLDQGVNGADLFHKFFLMYILFQIFGIINLFFIKDGNNENY